MRTLFNVSHYHLWCRCFHKRYITNWENPNKNNRQPYGTIVLLEAQPPSRKLGGFLNTRNEMKENKDLEYWKNNAKEDYLHTPISVLRYITELEEFIKKQK